VKFRPGGICRHLSGDISTQVVMVVALLGVLLSSSAGASAAPTSDPISGDWKVTYGAPATVTMKLADGVYTETAKTPVRVTGSSCDLPAGTVIATFKQTGPGAYGGQHGLWSTSNCSFSEWTATTFNLNSAGSALTANLGQGHGTATFTKI
jgi:uncharacterized protein (DUF2147 family)